MTRTTLLTLAKFLEAEAKDVRPLVRAGDHELDEEVRLRVEGTLRIGEDSEYAPTTSIPWKATLALFVRHCGATREHALRALVLAMRQALEQDEDAAELVAALTDLEEAEREVQASLDELPRQARRGPVSAKLATVTEVRPRRRAA